MKTIFSASKNKNIVVGFMCLYLFSSCAKLEDRSMPVDIPRSIVDQSQLDAYPNLKSYYDRGTTSDITFGSELKLADIYSNSLLYRTLQLHFNELSINNDMYHKDYVQDDGKVLVDNLAKAIEVNKNSGAALFMGHLVRHDKQKSAYLKQLIADIILPGVKGKDLVVDFENNKIGDTYPTSNSGATATVVADPEGKSKYALKVLKTTGTAFPQFRITLPEGRVLGQCLNMIVDFKAAGSGGLYGAGMRMGISTSFGDVSLENYGSPASFGNGDNIWGRGLISLPMSNLKLTEEQKKLNTFVLTLGSQTGSADYLIDNIQLEWEIKGETIRKTSAEKNSIITAQLDNWIKAIAQTAKEQVHSWSVIYQPMDETNPMQLRTGQNLSTLPDNTFYWQDYLGDSYAATAIQLLRKYSNSTDKVFFTETNLMDNPAKLKGLLSFIELTEKKGVKVDGIATELALNVDLDKSKIESLLKQLAETKKMIKITGLDIGTGKIAKESTTALYQQQADLYQWMVIAYLTLIPKEQQAGITFRSPLDQTENSTWRPNEPVGIWSTKGGLIRKPAYEGLVKALQR